jgi:hypothetical protein
MQVKNRFKGNYGFCSENVLFGATPSKRDDLESLAYVAVFLLQGKLPWSNALIAGRQLTEHRPNLLRKLMEGLPQGLTDWIQYCKSLRYEQAPDYRRIISMIEMCKEETTRVMSEHIKSKICKSKHKDVNSDLNSDCPTERSSLPEMTENIKAKSRQFTIYYTLLQKTSS